MLVFGVAHLFADDLFRGRGDEFGGDGADLVGALELPARGGAPALGGADDDALVGRVDRAATILPASERASERTARDLSSADLNSSLIFSASFKESAIFFPRRSKTPRIGLYSKNVNAEKSITKLTSCARRSRQSIPSFANISMFVGSAQAERIKIQDARFKSLKS